MARNPTSKTNTETVMGATTFTKDADKVLELAVEVVVKMPFNISVKGKKQNIFFL